ncbi:MFS transporter [Solirubrobacter ginsenosidimutans]|uniref:MFS transporter n=1 Tax=Solirubrobacter ginsenosidimutans TaxID=490573 RepID=A0A9X3S7J1_9ACTN|nr:MFS transporter [Solirubrobacter ginsenosidimutans]MDA0166096.1 MFS transporter [Solirubrobacter ginsenosidimutans]
MLDQSKAQQRKWWALALLATAQFVVVLDASVVNVALPSIGKDLQLSREGLAWLVNAYVLAFGGFLLLGGRMADLLGRRRVFMAGFTLFAVASFAGGLATSGGTLIAARALQGLGAAILSPAALSLVTTTFAEGAERNTALGVWGAVAAGGGAAGSLLGGVITQTLGWEWVLWINTPIGIAAAALAPTVLRESKVDAATRSFDALGAFTVTGGLVALVYGVIDGVKPEFVLIAAAFLAAFALVETRTANPLVPFRIFRSRGLTGATVTGVLMGGALIGLFFFATLYLQQVLAYGPLEAGLAFLPLALTIGASAGVASQLSTTLGPKPVLVAGLATQAAGLYWFSHVSANGSFLGDVLFPSLVVALGMGLAFVPLTIVAMSGVSEHESGLASGLMATAQQIGQAIGLALLTGVATTTATTPQALTNGFENAFLLAAAFALIAALAAFLIIRRTRLPQPGTAVPVPA